MRLSQDPEIKILNISEHIYNGELATAEKELQALVAFTFAISGNLPKVLI